MTSSRATIHTAYDAIPPTRTVAVRYHAGGSQIARYRKPTDQDEFGEDTYIDGLLMEDQEAIALRDWLLEAYPLEPTAEPLIKVETLITAELASAQVEQILGQLTDQEIAALL
jgi:hypothetical protein